MNWILRFGMILAFVCGEWHSFAAEPPSAGQAGAFAQSVQEASLPNAFWVHPRVISGGQPEGEAGFRALEKLGVQTVISVDGARPNVQLANDHGLRYVHLPHGYDGIPANRVLELAKAVQELPAPIYVHCHHGKHRSPAAAATACVAAGLIEHEQAVEFLKVAGTSSRYVGLHQRVDQTRPVNPQILSELNVEYRPMVAPAPLARAMVDLEHCFDRLRLLQENNWNVPSEHPDLRATHETLLLREHFVELQRLPSVTSYPSEFRGLIDEAIGLAKALEHSVAQHDGPSSARSMTALEANCRGCHQTYRDAPRTRND